MVFPEAAERAKLHPFLVGGRMLPQKIGQLRKPKSDAAHCTAFSHLARSSTFTAVGRTWTPKTWPVVVCAPHATKMCPCGLSTRTRHLSRLAARFCHCLLGGWTMKSLCCCSPSSSSETRAKTFSMQAEALWLESSSSGRPYKVVSIRVRPGGRMFGGGAGWGSQRILPGGRQLARGFLQPRSSTRFCCRFCFVLCTL